MLYVCTSVNYYTGCQLSDIYELYHESIQWAWLYTDLLTYAVLPAISNGQINGESLILMVSGRSAN